MSEPPPTASISNPISTPSFRLTVLISGGGTNLQALIDACQASQQPNPPSGTFTSTLNTDPLPTLPPKTHIVRVISNRKSAYGLQRAQNTNIPTTYHNLVAYRKALLSSSSSKDTTTGTTTLSRDDDLERQARENYDRDLAKLILADSPDLVVCAGFMHVLSGTFLKLLFGSRSESSSSQPDTQAHPLSSTSSPHDSQPQPQPHPTRSPGIINLHPALPSQFSGADAISRAWGAFQRGEIAVSGVMVHWVVEEVDMGEALVVQEVECRVGEGLSGFEERVHAVEWGCVVDGTRRALEVIKDRREKQQGENPAS